MSLDLNEFSHKVKRFVSQFMVSLDELSNSTGISQERIQGLINAKIEPSGDEVLIIADFFKTDYKYFISNEKEAPIEQTDILFRRHGKDFTKEDRMAVQEVLYMAECEHFLQSELMHLKTDFVFNYTPVGTYFKGHAEDAAKQLRKHLGYQDHAIRINVFDDVRKIGFHVFRRKLSNSSVSGVSIKHPTAGRCILVNYNEDIYRQRFTLVHEAAHGLFDLVDNQDVFVSYEYNGKKDLREIRADNFASNFLLPKEFILRINVNNWHDSIFVEWCNKLCINPEPFSIALKSAGLIGEDKQRHFKELKIPQSQKTDSELSMSMSLNAKWKKLTLLQKGLSDYYVKLCIEAYRENIVSSLRVAEMLLIEENMLYEIMELYGVQI
jgi:Zn-dependent peptidase ImmA (M78 family)